MTTLEDFLDFESWLYPKESLGETEIDNELLRRRFESLFDSPILMNIAWVRRELLKIALNTIKEANDEKNTASDIEGGRGVQEAPL